MREAREEKQEAVDSSLGHCLLDSDADSLRLAQSNRRRSMLLSSAIQALLLTAAVVAPLFPEQGGESFVPKIPSMNIKCPAMSNRACRGEWKMPPPFCLSMSAVLTCYLQPPTRKRTARWMSARERKRPS